MSHTKVILLITCISLGSYTLYASSFLTDSDEASLKHDAALYTLQFLQTTVYKKECSEKEKYNGSTKESLNAYFTCIPKGNSLIVDEIYKVEIKDNIQDFLSIVHDIPFKRDSSRKTQYAEQYSIFRDQLKGLNEKQESRLQAFKSKPKEEIKVADNVSAFPTVSNNSYGNKEEKTPSIMPILSFCFSCIALILSAILFYSSIKRSRNYESRFKELDASTNQLIISDIKTTEVKDFVSKREVDSLVSTSVKEELNKLLSKIKLSEQQSMQSDKRISQPQVIQASQSNAVGNQPKSQIKRLYARFSDGGNFFHDDILKEESERVSVFILELKENGTGEFYVNKDAASQQVALSDFEGLLGNCCLFKQYPNASTKGIETVKKGQLKKQGDKWMIISKAEISLI